MTASHEPNDLAPGVVLLPESFLGLLLWVKKYLPGKKFQQRTGVGPGKLALWKQTLKAKQEGVASVCRGLGCSPEELGFSGESLIRIDASLRDMSEGRKTKNWLEYLPTFPRSVYLPRGGSDSPGSSPFWTGRDLDLQSVEGALSRSRVVCIHGDGGTGKTALCGKAVEKHCSLREMTPAACFWWDFSHNRDVDAFLEQVLLFLGVHKLVLDSTRSPKALLRLLPARLSKPANGKLVVLDGLEHMQRKDGNVQRDDLRDFIRAFLARDATSRCIITSRLPLAGFDNPGCSTLPLTGLPRREAMDLYAAVSGFESEGNEEQVVRCGGNPLLLQLLGTLVRKNGGMVPIRLERLSRTATCTMRRYLNAILIEHGRALRSDSRSYEMILMVLSLFRLPPTRDSLQGILAELPDASRIPKYIATLGELRITDNYADEAGRATIALHSELVAYYRRRLRSSMDEPSIRDIHDRIHRYYVATAAPPREDPSIKDLQPLIEAVHHCCQAGLYGPAWDIAWGQISIGPRFALAVELGAFESCLLVLREFFPKGDTRQEPAISDAPVKAFILSAYGYLLFALGQLRESKRFHLRAISAATADPRRTYASFAHRCLAELYLHTGHLKDALREADWALREALSAEEGWACQVYRYWAACLMGNPLPDCDDMSEPFLRAVYGAGFVVCAHALIVRKDFENASEIIAKGALYCAETRLVISVSQLKRLDGDFAFARGDFAAAIDSYDDAIGDARKISFFPVLLEALIARGRIAIHEGDFEQADALLDEADRLMNRRAGQRWIFEADLFAARSLAAAARGRPNEAKHERKKALAAATRFNYRASFFGPNDQ